MVEAYVKGARCGNAQHAELEGSTAVFSRRRFRDKWNRTIVRRLARTSTHTARVKARVRARGVTGQQFFNDRQDDGPRLQLTLVRPRSSLAQRLVPRVASAPATWTYGALSRQGQDAADLVASAGGRLAP